METKILVKIADRLEDIIEQGPQIAKKILTQCQVDGEYQIVQIEKNAAMQYFAIIDYNECVADLIKAGELQHMLQEEYEKILADNEDAVSEIEFENEQVGESCTII